jgi:Glycosyl hydrolase family 12
MKGIYILFISLLIFSSGELVEKITACGAVCSLLSGFSKLFASQCGSGSSVQLGNSAYFFNNQWGSSAAKPGYYQCLDGTTVSYAWWSTDGKNDNVKAFPAIVTGWHWGYLNGQGSAGLPVLVQSYPKLIINWSVQHTNLGNYESYDTAFDMWLGGVGEQNPSGPTTEVMVWMNSINQYPLGSYVETINLWGGQFDVYAHFGGNPAWNVFSFLQKQGTWSFNNQNLFDFFYYLWVTKGWINGAQYICGIEAGNEIIQGQGSFTHTYSLKVN